MVVALAIALVLVLLLMPLSWLYIRGMFRATKPFNLLGVAVDSPHFASTLASISDSLQADGQAVHFYTDIDRIQQARLEAIAGAQHSIQFETFKMTPGQRAQDFAKALQQKARQGVQVQLLADSYGAKTLPETYWRSLTNAGVDVRFFNPFSWRSPVDFLRRNHRKLLIVDQTTALIGGAGISDFWDGEIPEEIDSPWFDFEVHWQGSAVGLLTGLFWQHWLDAGGYVDLRDHQPQRSSVPSPRPILITSGEDPTPQDSPIRSLFQTCVMSAQERIWIASPYLLPDQITCDILEQTRQRGVDVRVLTMGPHSDKFYVYYTSRKHYGKLLSSGVRLHEYQPSMMHAKVILVDHQWVSMGSANLDPRSFFHNDELNLATDDAQLIKRVEDFFQVGFEHSQMIQMTDWQKRPWQQKLWGSLFNIVYWQL
jgi:cardiolipin synthase